MVKTEIQLQGDSNCVPGNVRSWCKVPKGNRLIMTDDCTADKISGPVV